jgi:hypothetical protein
MGQGAAEAGGHIKRHDQSRPGAEGYTKPDPTRPMSGWRTAWRNLTGAIHCPACGHLQQPSETCGDKKCGADICNVRSPLHGLRFHDLRHHELTSSERLLGTPLQRCWRIIRMYDWMQSAKLSTHFRTGVQGVVTAQNVTQILS